MEYYEEVEGRTHTITSMPVSGADRTTNVRDPRSPGSAMPPGFALLASGRLVSNIAFRMVFPFLPRISRGLGVSLSTMGAALGLRELIGLANPVVGRVIDRRPRRLAIVVGMTGLSASLLLQGVSGGLLLFTAALVATSLAKAIFDISSSAWVSDRVPFSARGRAIGTLETTWALAFMVGMPLAALAIRLGTWRTPFLLIGLVCALLALRLHQRIAEPDTGHVRGRRLVWTPVLRGAVVTFALIGVAHQMLLVTFAAFLEDEHDVSVSALGLTALVIGIAELAGSGGVAWFSDRIGKAFGTEIALAVAAPVSLLLPFGASSLPLAMVLFAVWFSITEYAVVSMVTLVSELDTAARGAVMGMALAGFTVGHALGAVVGTGLYEWEGMPAAGAGMALAYVAGWTVARYRVFDPVDDEPHGATT